MFFQILYFSENPSLFQAFVDLGADVNYKERDIYNLPILAILADAIPFESIQFLINAGADLQMANQALINLDRSNNENLYQKNLFEAFLTNAYLSNDQREVLIQMLKDKGLSDTNN